MKTKKRVEKAGKAKGKTPKPPENEKGGGYIDAKAVKSKTEGKKKAKSSENVRTPS